MQLLVLVVALILIGIGLAVGLAACALVAALLGVGMISSSVLVGLRNGRTGAGIRAFLLQCGFFGGIPAGAICAWLVQSLFENRAADWWTLLYGGLAGACAGLLVGFAVDAVFRQLHAWATVRFLADGSEPAHEVTRSARGIGDS